MRETYHFVNHTLYLFHAPNSPQVPRGYWRYIRELAPLIESDFVTNVVLPIVESVYLPAAIAPPLPIEATRMDTILLRGDAQPMVVVSADYANRFQLAARRPSPRLQATSTTPKWWPSYIPFDARQWQQFVGVVVHARRPNADRYFVPCTRLTDLPGSLRSHTELIELLGLVCPFDKARAALVTNAWSTMAASLNPHRMNAEAVIRLVEKYAKA